MIDLHCHLDLYPDPAALIGRCRDQDLDVICVTTTPRAWGGTRALVGDAPRISVALGLHPELAHTRHHEVALFDDLLPKVRYVGEVGLDGSQPHRAQMPVQREVFEHVVKSCAVAGGRIISIHSRGAGAQVLDVLERQAGASVAVLHWFSGSLRELRRAIELGCWFSVGPAMLASSRGSALVAEMPRDRVLTETDGPFAKKGGVPLEPNDVLLAVRMLSELWKCPATSVHETLGSNFDYLRQAVSAQ